MSGKAIAGTPFRTDPKRKLTEKQALFLDALFDNGGKISEAMRTAGYNTSRSKLMQSMRDEIAARTKDYCTLAACIRFVFDFAFFKGSDHVQCTVDLDQSAAGSIKAHIK